MGTEAMMPDGSKHVIDDAVLVIGHLFYLFICYPQNK